MDKLLSISEAAALLKVHPETLRRWDNEEKLVAIKVNDRGDRRYRESDVLAFINRNPKLIHYGQIIKHGNYTIQWYNGSGFTGIPGAFGTIAKLTAQKAKNDFIGFAFAIAGLDALARAHEKIDYDSIVINKIKEFLDRNKANDGDVFTFEFKPGGFHEVQNPEWWQGRYSKTLVPGLRVESSHTVPITSKRLAWRAALAFKSKQGDLWLTTTFGSQHNFHEYFVWIDSKELTVKGLPNTEKSAEILAMDFIINRFNEAKDVNGMRDITKIEENNAACFNGKCTKNSWLPDELMK